MPIAPGTSLGPYEVISLAGSGGMGEVYKAKDTRLNRIVAVKVLPQHLSENSEARKRFEAEARVISTLNHPHICVLYDIGNQNGLHYMVMEYLEGETLRTRLTSGSIALRKSIDFASQIASGLAAAHEKGVVHRDLKPENIFLTREDRIKILDFGLAHHEVSAPTSEVSITPTRSRMTEPGMVMGTVGYMSPEQVRGQDADGRSDIFSLGLVLYEMLTGRRAFHRETSAETMTAILREDPQGIPDLEMNVSQAIVQILHHCIQKRPELRFQTPQDLAFALEMSGSQSARTAAIKTSAPRNWLVPVVVLISFVLGALALGFFTGKTQTKKQEPFFKQLTFKRGFVNSAVFAPDGTSIVYGAALDGEAIHLYSTRTDSIESRSLGLPPADILGISRTGQMAILLNRKWQGTWISIGTLAKVSVAGGAPREILENVNDGDISPDGNEFCIVRDFTTTQRLEYPIGKVLLETFGWISHPRISNDGKRIAFADHPIYGDDRGFLALAENGKVTRIAGEFSGITGVAWAPSGEIWVSGAKENEDGSLWAIQPGKPLRNILRSPVELKIQSVNSKGQVILTSGDRRSEMAGFLAGDQKERDLSWYGDEDVVGISRDATMIAASQNGSRGRIQLSNLFPPI